MKIKIRTKMKTKMKTRIKYLILLPIIYLIGCTPNTLIIPDMTITDPSTYKMFKKETIRVTTTDSVNLFIKNKDSGIIIERKTPLRNFSIFNYYFYNDSLFVDDNVYKTKISDNNIKEINFFGVWDDTLGFVSGEELNENFEEMYISDSDFFVGAVAGAGAGLLITLYSIRSHHTFLLFAVILIPIAAIIFGTDSEPSPSIEKVLQRIKAKRFTKTVIEDN